MDILNEKMCKKHLKYCNISLCYDFKNKISDSNKTITFREYIELLNQTDHTKDELELLEYCENLIKK